jgi:hypothetical protein
MLTFGPYTKTRAQVAVAQIKALCGTNHTAVTVRIVVDEASLSANDKILLRGSRGKTDPTLPPGGVDEALSFLSWFQLGESLSVFEVEVEGADAALAERIRRDVEG